MFSMQNEPSDSLLYSECCKVKTAAVCGINSGFAGQSVYFSFFFFWFFFFLLVLMLHISKYNS